MSSLIGKFSRKPTDSATALLLQATEPTSPPANAIYAADQIKLKNAWNTLSEKSKYALRDSVYQQGKSLGYDKACCRDSLERWLPVDASVGAKKTLQKQTWRTLEKSLSEIESGKAALNEVSTALTSQLEARQAAMLQEAKQAQAAIESARKDFLSAVESENAALSRAADLLFSRAEIQQAALLQQADQAQAVIEAARKELVRDRTLLGKEQALFAASLKNRLDVEKKLRACTHTNAETIAVQVGRETFDLSASDIREKGGLLKSIFFGGFEDPRDQDGIFHLRAPHLCASDFQLVSMYYAGELPAYISPEVKVRLLPLLNYLDLDDMALEISKRGRLPEPPPIQWEYKASRFSAKFQQGQSTTVHLTIEPGWEVVRAEKPVRSAGEYRQDVLLRRPRVTEVAGPEMQYDV